MSWSHFEDRQWRLVQPNKLKKTIYSIEKLTNIKQFFFFFSVFQNSRKKSKSSWSQSHKTLFSSSLTLPGNNLERLLLAKRFAWYNHRDKTRVQTPAKIFPHLIEKC
jgi:hypothetical protein